MKGRSEILLELLFSRFTRPKESRFISLFDSLKNQKGPTKNKKISLQISLEAIENGEDKRTSIMIKNIPNKITKEDIRDLLSDLGNINYIFLPYSKNSIKNLGFAFVNFVNYKNISQVYNKLNGIKLSNFEMKRPIEICYSKVQGKKGLSEMFGKK